MGKVYGVTDGREDLETVPTFLGGTVGKAVEKARSEARLLVIFIPAKKPSAGKNGPDQLAMRSVLSEQVSKMAEKKARKKGESGSYIFWGAQAGSPEALTALRRMNVIQLSRNKPKPPTIIVAYPARVRYNLAGTVPSVVFCFVSFRFVRLMRVNAVRSKFQYSQLIMLLTLPLSYLILIGFVAVTQKRLRGGQIGYSPKLLAQHHCTPPPDSESLAKWLDSLRKRHSKEFAKLQRSAQEAKDLKERKKGYLSSIKADVSRKQEEKQKQEETKAAEAAAKAREEEMAKRREQLVEHLPEEPPKTDKSAITVALRFMDGRKGQRRFEASTTIGNVLNWVDGVFEMERETVVLTTMNGKSTYSWEDDEDTTLSEAGLSRMTALRVSESTQEEEKDADGNNDDDDDDDDDGSAEA